MRNILYSYDTLHILHLFVLHNGLSWTRREGVPHSIEDIHATQNDDDDNEVIISGDQFPKSGNEVKDNSRSENEDDNND